MVRQYFLHVILCSSIATLTLASFDFRGTINGHLFCQLPERIAHFDNCNVAKVLCSRGSAAVLVRKSDENSDVFDS